MTLKLLQFLKRSATLALRWKTCAWTGLDVSVASEMLGKNIQKSHMCDSLFLVCIADHSRIIDCWLKSH